MSSCENEYIDAGLEGLEGGGGGGDPDTDGDIGDFVPPPLPRDLGGGGGGGGSRAPLLLQLSFGESARSSSSISWLVRGVSTSTSASAAMSVSRIGSKMDWRETLEVSVELLSDAIVGAVLWPVSMSRLKASASRDWRPGRGPDVACGSGAGSDRSSERRTSPGVCWICRRNGLADVMLGERETGDGLGARSGSGGGPGLGLNGSEEVGCSGGSGTRYFLGAIWERRRRGATGGGGLRGVGLVVGDDIGDAGGGGADETTASNGCQ